MSQYLNVSTLDASYSICKFRIMTDLITHENSSFSTTIQRFETFVVFDKFSFYLRGVLFSQFVHYDNQNKEKLFSNLVQTINLSLTILFNKLR